MRNVEPSCATRCTDGECAMRWFSSSKSKYSCAVCRSVERTGQRAGPFDQKISVKPSCHAGLHISDPNGNYRFPYINGHDTLPQYFDQLLVYLIIFSRSLSIGSLYRRNCRSLKSMSTNIAVLYTNHIWRNLKNARNYRAFLNMQHWYRFCLFN